MQQATYVVINKEIYSLVGRGQLLPVGNGIFFFFLVFHLQPEAMASPS